MKLIFEGTQEQLALLDAEFEMLKIEHGDNKLPRLREDYQTENLWCVADVQHTYDCTDEEALEVLEQALTNEATMEQMWFALDFHAEDNELTKKQ